MNVNLATDALAWRISRAGFGPMLVAALVLGALVTGPVLAQSDNKLDSVDVKTLPGQQVQLTLHTTGPAPQPLSFTIDKPARLSLDLPGVGLALNSRRIDVKSGSIDSVVAGEGNNRTRVVVNMDAVVPYETKVEGNTIVVTLGLRGGRLQAFGQTLAQIRDGTGQLEGAGRADHAFQKR